MWQWRHDADSGIRTMNGPLEGVVIADFSQLLQGPFATQAMADLGARVIKIEPLGGDWTRSYAMLNAYPGGESVSYLAFNRNKESIAIDLKSEEGLALMQARFGTVEVRRYDDTLRVTDPVDLLGYLTSLPEAEPPGAAAKLAAAVDAAFRTTDVFTVTKTSELLLGRG